MGERGSPVGCQVLDGARDPVILRAPDRWEPSRGCDEAWSRTRLSAGKPATAIGSPLELWTPRSLIPKAPPPGKDESADRKRARRRLRSEQDGMLPTPRWVHWGEAKTKPGPVDTPAGGPRHRGRDEQALRNATRRTKIVAISFDFDSYTAFPIEGYSGLAGDVRIQTRRARRDRVRRTMRRTGHTRGTRTRKRSRRERECGLARFRSETAHRSS